MKRPLYSLLLASALSSAAVAVDFNPRFKANLDLLYMVGPQEQQFATKTTNPQVNYFTDDLYNIGGRFEIATRYAQKFGSGLGGRLSISWLRTRTSGFATGASSITINPGTIPAGIVTPEGVTPVLVPLPSTAPTATPTITGDGLTGALGGGFNAVAVGSFSKTSIWIADYHVTYGSCGFQNVCGPCGVEILPYVGLRYVDLTQRATESATSHLMTGIIRDTTTSSVVTAPVVGPPAVAGFTTTSFVNLPTAVATTTAGVISYSNIKTTGFGLHGGVDVRAGCGGLSVFGSGGASALKGESKRARYANPGSTTATVGNVTTVTPLTSVPSGATVTFERRCQPLFGVNFGGGVELGCDTFCKSRTTVRAGYELNYWYHISNPYDPSTTPFSVKEATNRLLVHGFLVGISVEI